MSTATITYRINDSIVLDSGMSAIHRYEMFTSLYGKKIYGAVSGFATLDRMPEITSDNTTYHITEEQSRALKAALLSSTEIVDDGFLIE